MGGHAIGHIHHDPDTRSLKNLKELPPLHGIAAALDLAKEVLADADAARGIILAELLGLAGGAHHLADGRCIVDGHLHVESSRSCGFSAKFERLATNPFDRMDSSIELLLLA
ncbi:MAG: hypothetical protein QMD17_01965 [Rhodocyclaceae bacterium]|nr:hypothetical protein [Rhodocyclaceae bacterium]